MHSLYSLLTTEVMDTDASHRTLPSDELKDWPPDAYEIHKVTGST